MTLESIVENDVMAIIPYSSVVGSLMYIMVCSHLDLAYPLSHVFQLMFNPTNEHWLTIKWIFEYLEATKDFD